MIQITSGVEAGEQVVVTLPGGGPRSAVEAGG